MPRDRETRAGVPRDREKVGPTTHSGTDNQSTDVSAAVPSQTSVRSVVGCSRSVCSYSGTDDEEYPPADHWPSRIRGGTYVPEFAVELFEGGAEMHRERRKGRKPRAPRGIGDDHRGSSDPTPGSMGKGMGRDALPGIGQARAHAQENDRRWWSPSERVRRPSRSARTLFQPFLILWAYRFFAFF